jgi:class 3 adenylate cyclase
LPALAVVCGIALVTTIVIPSCVVASLFEGFTLREAVIWTAAVIAVDLTAIPIGCYLDRGTLAPLLAWSDRDFADPEAAWNAALAVPPTVGRTVGKGAAILSLVVCVPLAVYLGERTWTSAVGLGVGMMCIVMFAGLMFGNGLHALLRPCMEEIESVLSINKSPELRGWSLEARIALAFGTSTALAGMAATGLTLGTEATMRHFLMAIVLSAGLAGYLILVIQFGIAHPATSSVDDLLNGVGRVRRGDFSKRVPVTTVDEFGDLAIAFNEMQNQLHERESLQSAFGSYVDPTLAERLLAQDNSIFEGEEVDVTVFFADVRGFTTFAERVSAEDAVLQLNRLFEVVVPVIVAAGGHVNRYLGDEVLAVFGTPTPLADHAERAVRAAMDVQRLVRREFGDELQIGIGVNTGPVIAGSIGGSGHFEFTVIGDAVNVASRVERMTRQTGDDILITQATFDAMGCTLDRTTDRGEVEVRGKAQKHRLHAVDPF